MERYEFTMTRQARRPRHRRGQPDLEAQFGVVHPDIANATRIASAKLHCLGVRHALVGGMAVGAYARPRATRNVDFLVGAEAWRTEGIIVSPIAGLPVRVGGVAVDTLLAPPEALASMRHSHEQSRAPRSPWRRPRSSCS